MVWKMIFRF